MRGLEIAASRFSAFFFFCCLRRRLRPFGGARSQADPAADVVGLSRAARLACGVASCSEVEQTEPRLFRSLRFAVVIMTYSLKCIF